MAYKYKIKELSNPTDIISVDVPLFIRLLEYAREDAKTDMDLHDVAENIIKLSASGKALTMANYNDIVGSSKDKMNENEDIKIGDIVSKKYASTEDDYTKEFKVLGIEGISVNLQDTKTNNKISMSRNDLVKVPIKEVEFDDVKVGDVKIDRGIKSTITKINPETGGVSWDIDYVPAYDTVFADFTKLRKSIEQLAVKTKDNVVSNLTSNVKDLYNQYRTYIRKNQPDAYKRFGSVAEDGEGGSMSNAAGGYLGKYAYKLPKKQKDLGEETEAPKPNAKNPGATLGAGPSASAKGVKNNAYVKQFGYKLVK
jgi:hypothetical protein